MNERERELLSASLDGALSDAETREAEALLRREPETGAYLDGLRKTRELVGGLPRAKAPATVITGVKSAIKPAGGGSGGDANHGGLTLVKAPSVDAERPGKVLALRQRAWWPAAVAAGLMLAVGVVTFALNALTGGADSDGDGIPESSRPYDATGDHDAGGLFSNLRTATKSISGKQGETLRDQELVGLQTPQPTMAREEAKAPPAASQIPPLEADTGVPALPGDGVETLSPGTLPSRGPGKRRDAATAPFSPKSNGLGNGPTAVAPENSGNKDFPAPGKDAATDPSANRPAPEGAVPPPPADRPAAADTAKAADKDSENSKSQADGAPDSTQRIATGTTTIAGVPAAPDSLAEVRLLTITFSSSANSDASVRSFVESASTAVISAAPSALVRAGAEAEKKDEREATDPPGSGDDHATSAVRTFQIDVPRSQLADVLRSLHDLCGSRGASYKPDEALEKAIESDDLRLVRALDEKRRLEGERAAKAEQGAPAPKPADPAPPPAPAAKSPVAADKKTASQPGGPEPERRVKITVRVVA